MKKLLTAMLATVLSVSLFGCGSSSAAATAATETAATGTEATAAAAATNLKIGVILVGDENEGYTKAHIDGINEAAKSLGISDDQIIWKYSIGETQDCEDAANDLVDQGCTLVVSNSYGHQTYMFNGAFGTSNRIWVTLKDMSLLLCIAVGLAPAFKMRFWNIGAEGQVLIGGLVSAALMIHAQQNFNQAAPPRQEHCDRFL